ncbi:cytochrome c-type biogenesis protein [Parvularcula lutaonensis]|uniref:Cytochrome c-type biogenesis protein n=1 Tax=Parvularcula lutaonensis TaxID=491923 RepID=A0ABV7MAP9_9PROT|nr:cytochrome c-type biogenesis protein [Parvularcula lutaonensis]GGY45080.1 hypothetical protein GCM10007148_12560 [Parvularcula lutaonensis]
MIALLSALLLALTPAQQARADAIFKDIRCVVCQNQSIAESDAELARVMRALVEERIAAGDTDAEVKAYLTARYGEAVLLTPTASPKNYVLWAGPVLALMLGGIWAFSLFRGSAKARE